MVSFEHPGWCNCPACTQLTNETNNEELSANLDESVAFINKMVWDTTRTIFKVFRRFNHYEDEREDNEMAFHIGGQTSETNTGNGRGTRKRKGLPFLDPERDLGEDKRRVKILWAGDPKEANVNADWALVTLKLESVMSKTKRLWTLGGSNPVLALLIQAMGDDANKWEGRELWMWVDSNNPSETPFVRAETAEIEKTSETTQGGKKKS